jgi:peptide/nickel transport system permease protein
MAPPVPNVPLSVQLEVMPGSTLPSLLSGRRLRNQRLARALRLWVPAGVLIFILALCFLWPLVYHLPSPTAGNILYNNEPPLSPGHILGTNVQGVDEFSDVVYGGQTSFEIAASVTVIGIVIGCTLGVVAGYFGGWVDAIISRILDVLIAFPALVLALVIAVGLGPSEIHLIWALSFFGIPALGRVTRGITLTLRSQPYMTAARLAGTSRWRIIVRHILPNIMPTIVTFALLGIGIIIILEGALDFLGYGIQQPQPSWGGMIALGQQIMTAQPEYILIPSIALLVTVVALNMLGDALRERWGVV